MNDVLGARRRVLSSPISGRDTDLPGGREVPLSTKVLRSKQVIPIRQRVRLT